MKFAFVHPYISRYKGPVTETALPPLSLVNCATILQKKGFEVEVIDAGVLKLSTQETAREVNEANIVVITTSPINTWQCPPLEVKEFYDTVSAIKQENPEAFIISVGPSSIFNPKGLAEVSDLVILGQPEPFFQDITPEMSTGSFFDIQGIAYQKEGKFHTQGGVRWYNLRELPQPNFKLLPYDQYEFALLPGKMMLIESSRGCPEGCSFCFQGMTNSAYSFKSPEQIVGELQYIHDELGIRNVFIIDLEVSVAKENFRAWMKKIVEIGLDIDWVCQIRMSVLEEDLVALMAEAGCKVVLVGLESPTDGAFKDLPKNKSKDFSRQRVEMCHKHGIKVLGYFLIGTTYDETVRDVSSTVSYAHWLDVDFAVFSVGRPYPTTGFYEEVKGLPHTVSQERIPVAFERNFTEKEMQSMRRKAYLRFYTHPRYVLKHLYQLRHPKKYVRDLKLFVRTLGKD